MNRELLFYFDFKKDAKSIKCPSKDCGVLSPVEDWADTEVECLDCRYNHHYAIKCPACGEKFDHIHNGHKVNRANSNITRGRYFNGKWYLRHDQIVIAENVIGLEDPLEPCPHCKWPRGRDENGAYICPCPGCGDEIPF